MKYNFVMRIFFFLAYDIKSQWMKYENVKGHNFIE